jgi:integrase
MTDDTTIDAKTRTPRSRMADRPPITDDLVRGLDRTGKPAIIYDGGPGAIRGFGVRRTDRVFVLNYYTRTGTERRYPIGAFPAWKVEKARRRALELRVEIDKGNDPMGEEHAARKAPTVADLVARFREDHLPARRPKTVESYVHQLDRYILPALGHLRVDDVAYEHADALFRQITKAGHPAQANRVRMLGHVLFAFAGRLRMRADQTNPFKHVKLHREHPRHRYLKPEELQALLDAMARHPDTGSVRAIKLLLLTGARRGEVLAMRGADIDLGDKPTWSKPPTGVKQDRAHHVPLNGPTVALLSEIAAEQAAGRKALPTFVFPGAGTRGHLTSINRVWRNLTRDAQLKDFRLHDLRHAHASFLASGGSSLLIIGGLLGHASAASTKRYSHLLDDPLREASERVGALIVAADTNRSDPRPPAEVVSLPKRHGR